jgi:cytochrome P450
MTEHDAVRQMSVDDLPLATDRAEAWRCLHAAGEVVDMRESYVLASAAAVEEAARHPEIFSSKSAFDRLGSPLPIIPIAVDPPEHSRYRRMLDPFFSPRRMAAIESQLRAQVGELIDNIVKQGHCELLADLAVPYPTQVFLTLFGLPLEDRDRLVQWKDSILEFTNPTSAEPTPEVLQHAMELFGYLSHYVGERRHGDGQDLLTQLLATKDEGGLTDEEMIGLSFLFVLAGLDTVTAALGFAFARLAEDDTQRAKIVQDPATIPDFIEELLRVDPPVPFAPRVVMEDVVVRGTTLPAGTSVLLSYGGANHDTCRYADPDNVAAESSPHFSFGRGPHRCLGSHLARLELRVVLEEWHRRIPEYSLAPGAKPSTPWPSGTLSLDSVPLVFPV